MDPRLERKLIEGLDALEKGETVEQILSKNPADANALRPMLETAAQLGELRVAHTMEAQAASRSRFLDEAKALSVAKSTTTTGPSIWRRLVMGLAAAAAMLFLLAFGLSYAAAQALPGDGLYETKRTIEGVRLNLTNDSMARQSLLTEFQQERLREIRQLLERGRVARVSFSGTVQEIAEQNWIVAGLPVRVDAQTEVRGDPSVGKVVQIEGQTMAGFVVAETVDLMEPDTPQPAPAPQAPEPDETTEAPPSHTPTVAPTATATATPSPSATPSPTATPTPSPEATMEGLDAPDIDNDRDTSNGNDANDSNDNDANDNDNDDDDNSNDNENASNENASNENASNENDSNNNDNDADDDNENDSNDNDSNDNDSNDNDSNDNDSNDNDSDNSNETP